MLITFEYVMKIPLMPLTSHCEWNCLIYDHFSVIPEMSAYNTRIDSPYSVRKIIKEIIIIKNPLEKY